MLGVARHTWRVAVLPAGINVVHILQLPVLQRTGQCGVWRAVDTGFLPDFAHRSLPVGFFWRIFAAGHRLPEISNIGATDQQDLQRRGVYHHQHRFGNLEDIGHGKGAPRAPGDSASGLPQGPGFASDWLGGFGVA